MKKICAALILILLISVSVYAQDKEEASADGNNCCDCLFMEVMIADEDLWDQDLSTMAIEIPIDIDWMFDFLLDSYLELDVVEEDVYEVLPELWEPDYELFLIWEDEW